MKNKNIILGLGLGLLTNLNNNTKKRSSDIISEDGEYIERLIKLVNTSDEFDFQLRIKAPKKWTGGWTKRYVKFEIIDKKTGNLIPILNYKSLSFFLWKINFVGTWDSITLDDNIYINLVEMEPIHIEIEHNLRQIKIISFHHIPGEDGLVFGVCYTSNSNLFFILFNNKKQLINYFEKSFEERMKKELNFDIHEYLLFVKGIPELFSKTLKENDKLLEYFKYSLEENSDWLKEFKKDDKLPKDLLKIIEEMDELIKIKEFLAEAESFFEAKSKLLNDLDSLITKKPKVLIKHKLLITEKPELQEKLEEFLKEKPELLNKFKSLLI